MKKRYLLIQLGLFCTHSPVAADSDITQLRINSLELRDWNDLSEVAALSSGTATSQPESPANEGDPLTSDRQIFGYQGGYFHASLGLKGEYTDNLFNTDEEHEDDFLTAFIPSVWVSLPRRSREPIQISPKNTSAGGLPFSQPDNRFANRYQLYAKGSLAVNSYAHNSNLNQITGSLEGMFQYNPAVNLSLELVDKFSHSQDQFALENATSGNQRLYNSNLFRTGVDWNFSDKFSTRFNYSRFDLFYEDDINNLLDRTDNGFDIAAYYDYSPKTNFFLQYQYVAAVYDVNDELDNDNNYLYAGINWQYSVKTWLMAKAGYQNVTFSSTADPDNPGSLALELQMNWRATVKTSVFLAATYNIEQSDSYSAWNKTVLSSRLGYEQRLSERISGSINLLYENSDYNQFDDIPRQDNRYVFRPQLNYLFQDWLKCDFAYSYDIRDSSDDTLDYATNFIRLGLTGSF